MDKIKIMHLITGLNLGGTELFLSRLLPSLMEYKHLVVSLTGKGEIGKKLERQGIKVYELKSGRIFSLFAVWRFLKIVESERPDILSTWLLRADIFGRLFGRLFGIKKIVTNARLVLPFRKYWPYIIFTKLTKNYIDEWTANSRTVYNFYINKIGIKKEKIHVIYNGIDPKGFNIDINRDLKRTGLDLNLEDFVIICVSRLSPQKGIDILIKAARMVADYFELETSRSRIIFLIVGKGQEENRLKKMVKRLRLDNIIYFLGEREDIPELLKISDLFVLPTLFEGMSNAILEAMAAGLPVITTDIPENRELIENNKNGFLVSLRDTQSLSNIIIGLYEDHRLRDRISQNAKKIIQDMFDFQVTIKMFRNLFFNS